jgi:hypothetical protein
MMTRLTFPARAVALTALGLLLGGSGVFFSAAAHAQNARSATSKPSAAAPLVVRGTIRALTRSPRPGSVPYKDAVIALHLTGVQAVRGGKLPGARLLLYTWGMKDNKLSPAAFYKPGQTITLALRPWAAAEETYGGYNRVDFEDDALLALPTFWAEPAPKVKAQKGR